MKVVSKSGGNPALEQLLNGLVYELYFPDDLHARGLYLFDAAHKAGLGRLADLAGSAVVDAVTEFARKIVDPSHEMYRMLFDLRALDVVRLIEGAE